MQLQVGARESSPFSVLVPPLLSYASYNSLSINFVYNYEVGLYILSSEEISK